ncbi:hypothetical protein ACQUSR_23430 [Streptomyces sp. P1-3]|uniref:hypothetical protein n=1 Tax=Streptomyces sp. P1-3 TaxID=3421658 RepID=UPI003D361623
MARGNGDDGRPVLAHDSRWVPDLRTAVCAAAALLAVMLLLDSADHHLAPPRAAAWTGVALLLFAVLCPRRVTAGDGWLASRGAVGGERRVRTDLLTSVTRVQGTAPRLILRDVLGRRVELDPKVLTGNPLLWHELDRGVRLSRARGLLRNGERELRVLADHIDGDGARRLLEAAGVIPPSPGPGAGV